MAIRGKGSGGSGDRDSKPNRQRQTEAWNVQRPVEQGDHVAGEERAGK